MLKLFVILVLAFGADVLATEEKYHMKINELGAKFTEEIKIDLDAKTEVINVPPHRFLDGVSVLNDFKVGMSAYRIKKTKSCYISIIPKEEAAGPRNLKLSLDKTNAQLPVDKVVVRKHNMVITGRVKDVSKLSQRIQNHCAGYRMYWALDINTKLYKTLMREEIKEHIRATKSKKQKRRIIPAKDIHMCQKPEEYSAEVGRCRNREDQNKIQIRCEFKANSCIYITSCSVNKENNLDCAGDHSYSTFMCCRTVCNK